MTVLPVQVKIPTACLVLGLCSLLRIITNEAFSLYFHHSGQIAANESLFYYRDGFTPDTYRDEGFRPVFEFTQPSPVILDACDGNEWCVFDLQVTGDMEVAMASKNAYDEQVAVTNASMEGNCVRSRFKTQPPHARRPPAVTGGCPLFDHLTYHIKTFKLSSTTCFSYIAIHSFDVNH